jgi:hypothetical protein
VAGHRGRPLPKALSWPQQTWWRGEFVATDVAPCNAIITEADELRAIDFVVTRLSDEPQ